MKFRLFLATFYDVLWHSCSMKYVIYVVKTIIITRLVMRLKI